jgi:hypothetical protein
MKPYLFALPALAISAAPLYAQKTLVLDDFEDGVGRWTTNDKTKTLNPSAPVLLVDVLATRPSPRQTPTGPAASTGAGLFTFKAASNSWASASLRVSGSQWAQIGARSIKFWLDADGQSPGVEMLLRGSARNPDGSTRDVAYELPIDPATKKPKTIKLSSRSWREVVVPLNQFRDKNGASVLSNLGGLYLLQFVQRGNWNSRFFTLDDISIQGTGKPIVIRTASTASTSAGTPGAASPTPGASTAVDADAIPVEIDFLVNPRRRLGRIRASANLSVGLKTSPDGVSARPFDDANFSAAVKYLKPRMVRLEAGEMVELIDSSRPAFDFSSLQKAAASARAVGAEPLVSLAAPTSWGLDARGYGAFAAGAARALSANTSKPTRYFEMSLGNMAPAAATAYYRSAYAAVKAVAKTARVGGPGSSNPALVAAILKNAPGLDFLSVPFHGANAGAPEWSTLLNATLSLPALRAAAGQLDRSRFQSALLFVTSAGVNAARAEGSALPSDNRLDSLAASAWWSSFLLNGSRVADQVFFNDAANPEWGLVNEGGRAFQPYYALYLWNIFFPPGSERVSVKVTGAGGARGLQIGGANTPTAHNAIFVNTSDETRRVRLTIRGFLKLSQARIRILQDPLDPKQGIAFSELPKSPFQNFELPPYSTAVLQFIEPPKSAARR